MEQVVDQHKASQVNSRLVRESIAIAIEEKKRRVAENGIDYYIPQQSPGNPQLEFHKSKKRVRAIFGGNRSGKSVSGACEAVWYATGTHPFKSIPTPNYGRVCCTDFTNGIEKVIIPEIKKWLPKDALKPGKQGWNAESRTLYLKNGSTIEFMSYDQDVEKFASASRHWIWFDEEPSQDIYNECKMRLIDTKGDTWFTLTPVNGMTWIYSDIYEKVDIDPNIAVFHFDTRINPYIDMEILDDLMRGMSEAEMDMRLGGKFVSLSGLIYKEFNLETHTIGRFKIPDEWPKICAIDPHPRNPTVVVYMSIAPTAYFIAECYKQKIILDCEITDSEVYIIYDEVYPQNSMLISDTAKTMKMKEVKDIIRYRMIDSSANTPDPIIGRTLRQEFERHGIRTIIADKDITNGVLKVREKLQKNALYIFNDVHNTIWEIRHYVWDDYKIGKDFKDPKEKPRKKRDHAMDCLRYMCSSCPKYDAPQVYQPVRQTINKYTGY